MHQGRIAVAFVVASMLAMPVLAQDADNRPPPVRGASLTLAEEAAEAGTPVRLRVRGEVLAELLKPNALWHLSAAGEAMPAELITPVQPPHVSPGEIEILRQSDAAAAELVAVLDRGEAPAPLDHLQLYFASLDVLALVEIAASLDDEIYVTCGEAQVVWQTIEGGAIRRITTLACQPGESRYLRLTVPNARGLQLERVKGWLAVQDTRDVYEMPAALGAMRPGTAAGEHIWPLELADNTAELVKLKVIAAAPGETRNIRVVRLRGEDQLATTEADAIWADGLSSGGRQRSEKWIQVNGSAGDVRPWALIVEDGERATLQVSAVQVYAAEYWLEFVAPEAAPLELWLAPAPRVVGALEPAQMAAPVIGGEIRTLDLQLETPPPAGKALFAHDWLDRLTPLFDRWGRLVIFALGGLVLLIAGLVLLRRPRPNGETD